jgi:hypothetical protein
MSYDPYNQQPIDPYNLYNPAPQPMGERPTFPTRGASIQVEMLLVVPTGTYQQQWRRPFVTQLDNNNITQVYDVVSHAYHDFMLRKKNGSLPANAAYDIDPMQLSAISSSFIKPAMGAEAPARLNLKHSLEFQTARFVLRIAVQRHGAVEPQRFVMTGYTSHMGILQKAGRAGLNQSDYTLDPLMELTINSVMEVRKVTRNYGYGDQIAWEMHAVHQVLVDTEFRSVDDPNVIRMRPYEVTSALSRMHDPRTAQRGIDVTDTRYMQTTAPEFSDVHNTNPNNYMAKILGGLAAGRDAAIETNMSSLVGQYTQAGRILRDPISREDPFLKALASFDDGIVSATFKFRDLLAIDPNADSDQVCKINMRDFNAYVNKRGENMAYGRDTQTWNGRDLATEWAVQVTNMLPPMMMDLAMRRVEVFASNSFERMCKATNAWPFVEGVDLSPQMRTLDILFYEQFVRPMTGDGDWMRYDLDIVADLYGDIVIGLSLNGSPRETFVFPAFMGSAMAPVLTSQPDTLDHIASEFKNLQAAVLPPINQLVTDVAQGVTPSGTRY